MFARPQLPMSGECDEISYRAAIKRRPKEGRVIFITPVTWEGAPINLMTVDLKSLGAVELASPVSLPKGYRMNLHETWIDAWKNLYDSKQCEKYSFEELDNIIADWHTLEKFTGSDFGDIPVWDDRRDYCDWTGSFDEKWSNLRQELIDLVGRAIPPHKEPFGRTDDGLPNRVDPPSLAFVLREMIRICAAQLDGEEP